MYQSTINVNIDLFIEIKVQSHSESYQLTIQLLMYNFTNHLMITELTEM